MEANKDQELEDIFALDIGTRSIIGVVGRVEGEKFHVLAIEKANHGQRAMLDGQIENIEQVTKVARGVIQRLSGRTRLRLRRVCVAAAGRALKSEQASFRMELAATQPLSEEIISHLEAGAVSEAEARIVEQTGQQSDQYYMVGYTVIGYRLDGYPISSIREHSGRVLEADVVATFLPREVVESLYAVVGKLGLEISSLTLEPIAALNAAIPADIRLLNLVLVDIGAGTSDIAACRDGGVVGYTMATVAGDEITEQLMRTLLIDFKTGEELKMALGAEGSVTYTDILGIVHETDSKAIEEIVNPVATNLAKELAARIMEVNGRMPSAVFLAGGGSKLRSLREKVAAELKIDPSRVAIAGNHFLRNAYAEEYDLNDPEYATPLGIAISAGLGLINDSYIILLNGAPAKLFRSGVLLLRDILLTNGYRYAELIGRTGANLTFTFNGTREFVRGSLPTPAAVQVNGREALLTDLVHAGDSITFLPAVQGADARRTVRQLLGVREGEDALYDGMITINGVPSGLDDEIHTGDEVWADEYQPRREKAEEAPPAAPKPAPGPPLRLTMNGMALELPGKSGGDPYYLMDLLEYSGIDFGKLDGPVELLVNGEAGQFSQRLYENDDIIIRLGGSR